MKAVVMAGGEGTRLRPLTSNQPKPMVPIVGKPCMEHILELLREHGFDDVIVTRRVPAAGDPQLLRRRRGARRARSSYSVEESPAGTAGSVRLADGRARRDVPRHLRRRALRHRPRRSSSRSTSEKGAAVTIGAEVASTTRSSSGSSSPTRTAGSSASSRSRRGARSSPTRSTPASTCSSPRCCATCPTDRPYDFSKELFPLPARDGPAALRLRLRRLLAGHRQPRPVPAGELRRARRAGAARTSPASGCAGTSGSARAWSSTTSSAIEGPAFIGNYCRIAPEATRRPVLGARRRA